MAASGNWRSSRFAAIRPLVAVLAVGALSLAISPVVASAAAASPGVVSAAKPKPQSTTPTRAASRTAFADLPVARNSEARLQPNAVTLLRLIEKAFPYYSTEGAIYGWREDPIPDHPSGQALDIMLRDDGRTKQSVSEGATIAGFLMANWQQLGVVYFIFRQQIWHPGQAFRLMEDRGDWTQNHMNHIHVLVNGQHAAYGPLVSAAGVTLPADRLPDPAALRRAQEARIAALRGQVVAARKSARAAARSARVVRRQWGSLGIGVTAAQRQVDLTIRRAYMLAGDEELVKQTEGLFVDPRALGTAALVADRTTRLTREEYEAAKAALVKAKGQVARSGFAARQAKEQLARAEQALREAIAGL